MQNVITETIKGWSLDNFLMTKPKAESHTSQKRGSVFVGMSGGVDSSVSASLLKEKGYDVTGVFIKSWQPPFMACPQTKDREDAMQVASMLGIKFKTLDLSDEYKKYVVDYMIREYKRGRTPNPDVMCNHFIKFGKFYNWAMENGADYIATGHYARISSSGEIREYSSTKSQILNKSQEPNTNKKNYDLQSTIYKLKRGIDENKDQTYFLWKLSSEKLEKILFPVGEMKKSEVRECAKDRGLHVFGKKDSTGVCFIGEIDMKEFLKNQIETQEGDVLNLSGEVIGKHDGAILYTLGQRRGFEVVKKSPSDGPHFVVGKDIKKNTITVATNDEKSSENININKVILEDENWITEKPEITKKYKCRYRHRQKLQDIEITSLEPLSVKFLDNQQDVSPGQSLVIYDGERCMGGGIIRETNSK